MKAIITITKQTSRLKQHGCQQQKYNHLKIDLVRNVTKFIIHNPVKHTIYHQETFLDTYPFNFNNTVYRSLHPHVLWQKPQPDRISHTRTSKQPQPDRISHTRISKQPQPDRISHTRTSIIYKQLFWIFVLYVSWCTA